MENKGLGLESSRKPEMNQPMVLRENQRPWCSEGHVWKEQNRTGRQLVGVTTKSTFCMRSAWVMQGLWGFLWNRDSNLNGMLIGRKHVVLVCPRVRVSDLSWNRALEPPVPRIPQGFRWEHRPGSRQGRPQRSQTRK